MTFLLEFLGTKLGRYVLGVVALAAFVAGGLAIDRRRIAAAEARGRAQAIAEAAARLPATRAAVDSAVRRTDASGTSVDSAIARVDEALEAAARRAARARLEAATPRPVVVAPAPAVAAPETAPAAGFGLPAGLVVVDTTPGLVAACLELRNSCAAFREDVALERAARAQADRDRDLEDLRQKDRVRELERRPSRKVAIAGAVGAAVLGFLAGRQ